MLSQTAHPRPVLMPAAGTPQPRVSEAQLQRYREARARIAAQRSAAIGAYGYLRSSHD